MRMTLLLALLLAPCLSHAQAFETKLTPAGKSDYASIEFMSAAQASALQSVPEESPAADPRDRTLRLVVYRSEIYQSVAIETITTGLEGCCTKLAASRLIDLQAFATHFGFKGELNGFVFSGWSSPNSFRFTFRDVPFSAVVLASPGRVRIEREAGR